MITRFPGTCACGCRTRYLAGADVTRATAGWVLTSCSARPAPPPPSTGFAASMTEVLEILARARAVRDRGGPAGAQPALVAQGARR